MDFNYDGEHVFRFVIPEAIASWPGGEDTCGYEVDRLTLTVSWCEADGQDPAGWFLYWRLQGWPLTKAGKRDKRVRERSSLHEYMYPKGLQPIAVEAFRTALEHLGLTEDVVINSQDDMLNPERYLAE